MATLTQSFLGLADIYKRTDGMGQFADIIEMMNDTSRDIFDDYVMTECNSGDSHLHTIRTGLPSVAWGRLYQGIPQSKSATQQVKDTTGFVEALSTVDQRLLDLAGANRLQLRASEGTPFIESMTQELVTSLFYHNSDTDPTKPKGLSARFGVKATSGAGNQIIDAGGTGSDNTSIWMVGWGGNGVCGLYPKGTPAGISQEDMGRQRVLDGSGNPYYVEEEMFRCHMGYAVKDYRYVVRIANIDTPALAAGTVDLFKWMRQGYYRLHNRRVQKVYDQDKPPARTVIYCNSDVLEALDALSTNAGSSDNYTRLRPGEIEGKEVQTYRGLPLRETDALLNTEARVV